MWPYYVMVAVPATLSIYSFIKKKENKSAILGSFFAIWMVLLICRSESVGADLQVYKSYFEQASRMTFPQIFSLIVSGEYEFGYFFISKIISVFTSEFRVMLVAVALISVIPLWYLYQSNIKDCQFLALSVFLNLGLFSMYFSGLRQIMAMAFVVPVYYCTKNKKPWYCLILCLLAFLFHKSALILLFIYPVYHLKIKNKWYLLLVVPVILLTFIYRKSIFLFLSSFIGDYYKSNITETGAYSVFALLLLLTFAAFVIVDYDQIDEDFVGLRNILIFSAFLQMFASLNTLATRMNYYFFILVPIIVSRIASCSTKRFKNTISVAFFCMSLFFVFYHFYKANTGIDYLQIYPYIPFWD